MVEDADATETLSQIRFKLGYCFTYFNLKSTLFFVHRNGGIQSPAKRRFTHKPAPGAYPSAASHSLALYPTKVFPFGSTANGRFTKFPFDASWATASFGLMPGSLSFMPKDR